MSTRPPEDVDVRLHLDLIAVETGKPGDAPSLLDQVNADRRREGLPPVELDE